MASWDEVQSTVRLLQRQLDEMTAIHAALHKQQCDVNGALFSIPDDVQQPCVQHPGARIRALGARLETAYGLLTEAICWISEDNTMTYGAVSAELNRRLETQVAAEQSAKNSHQP
jgi:hypothetical protein